MKYPKMDTLWKRNDKGKILVGEYSKEEFNMIKNWYVTEKIDGTNIRIDITFDKYYNIYKGISEHSVIKQLLFKGRTDKSEIPQHLLQYLKDTFTNDLLLRGFKYKDAYPNDVIIYGEGYGNKINNGQNKYRKDVSLICFDIWVDGIWLNPEQIKIICNKMNIDYVPELECNLEEEIIKLVKSGYISKIGLDKNIQAEGVVVKTNPILLFRDGTPLKWKLKTRDYKRL